jgi:hypothetical protein
MNSLNIPNFDYSEKFSILFLIEFLTSILKCLNFTNASLLYLK